MRVAIDGVGRIVIPKPMREELGIDGPTELELTASDGALELTVPDANARVEERDGLAVIVIDPPPPMIDPEEVRATIERVRR
ncbi:MAG: Antitoxin [Solirubrobacterales bacterium]|jgi:AbrB family looped-hinge helix DNA binding protein|nr:Antitoxin [Solirubrobacterales bacterium]